VKLRFTSRTTRDLAEIAEYVRTRNACCLALSKVCTFGRTFRAENSNPSRHLVEFWIIEPEIAFANLSDKAALAGALLRPFPSWSIAASPA